MKPILCLYSCWKSRAVSWGWRKAQTQQDTGQRLHDRGQSEILYGSNEGSGAQWHQRNCSSSSPQRCLLNGGSYLALLLFIVMYQKSGMPFINGQSLSCFHAYSLPILGLVVLPAGFPCLRLQGVFKCIRPRMGNGHVRVFFHSKYTCPVS